MLFAGSAFVLLRAPLWWGLVLTNPPMTSDQMVDVVLGEVSNSPSIAELERRLSFLTWPDERLKLERTLLTALRAQIVQDPYDSAAYGRLADLHLNGDVALAIPVAEARFAFLSTYRLANARPEVRSYIAAHCVKKSPAFLAMNITLCERLPELLPPNVSLTMAANLIGVTESALREALRSNADCAEGLAGGVHCATAL